MPERIACYVMSGGIGARLWPLSREDYPKQFHNFFGAESMLRQTMRRALAREAGPAVAHVIANASHAERVRADLAGLTPAAGLSLFEPLGRNTAAVVALAALHALRDYGGGLVLALPADHMIASAGEFWKTIEAGTAAAKDGLLVTFGIRPDRPATGYGYIEMSAPPAPGTAAPVVRFVEKPDLEAAQAYLAAGVHYWNSGIFLFDAAAMREVFLALQPEIWTHVAQALEAARSDDGDLVLPAAIYAAIPRISIDHAIMERAGRMVMTPASFAWDDLGSWQAIYDAAAKDGHGNACSGDVVTVDCGGSYFRAEGRLVTAVGLRDMAVIATGDSVFIAPLAASQDVPMIVGRLDGCGRPEGRITPSASGIEMPGFWRKRVEHWLFAEALPVWSSAGVDHDHGGFHEALSLHGEPLARPRRMRTMARQTYAFAIMKLQGWTGDAEAMVDRGLRFIERGRTPEGGWVRTLTVTGEIVDATEDSYDIAFVLLALAHAARAGHPRALALGEETFAFLDRRLADPQAGGYRETAGDSTGLRRANPHMHLLEAFLAWHKATGEPAYLQRAAGIVDLFSRHFFDAGTWTLGEFFDDNWQPSPGAHRHWTEPGHHFEWAWLLVGFAQAANRPELIELARKLYVAALGIGINRATGLAYGAVSKTGTPLDEISRSWPQAEALKAAIALSASGGLDLSREIEARVAQLFHWHLDRARPGLWIDRIDAQGRPVAEDVPASIFYHMICALTEYLGATAMQPSGAA